MIFRSSTTVQWDSTYYSIPVPFYIIALGGAVFVGCGLLAIRKRRKHGQVSEDPP